MELRNKHCTAKFHPERKAITMDDLTDSNNLPSAYNRTRRGIKKAWAALEASWTEEMRFYEAVTLVDTCGVKMNTYYAMD
jgi:hypothetical protein